MVTVSGMFLQGDRGPPGNIGQPGKEGSPGDVGPTGEKGPRGTSGPDVSYLLPGFHNTSFESTDRETKDCLDHLDLQDKVVQQASKAHLVLMEHLGPQERREKRGRKESKVFRVQLDHRLKSL